MNLSAPFVQRPIMTTLVTIAFLLLGMLCYTKLPVSDLPSVEYPTLQITASLPGADPQTMAESIATPLERAFTTVNGLRVMTSWSSQGEATISMQFHLDIDINAAAQDVNAAISNTLPSLPSNMPNNPIYEKVNPAATPVLYLTLSSATMSQAELYEYADTYIGKKLAMVEGVSQVLTYGAAYAARIQIDPQRLAAMGLDFSTVTQAVVSGTVNDAIGYIDGSERYALLRNPNGQLYNAKEYNALVIDYINGNPLWMHNVGKAVDSTDSQHLYLHYICPKKNLDETTVVLGVQRQPKANTIAVVEGINTLLKKLERELPKSVTLDTLFSRADTIIESITDVKITLLIAFLLVVLVIFLYLGRVRDALIPLIVIPLSLIGTFIFMYLAHFSLDNLSLMALLLVIGFVVDDAIVVLENIVRHLEMGKQPEAAAMEGSKQISITVLTMTVALSGVFIPLLFLAGMLGRLFNEFAITMVIAILLSGVLSLTVTPMLAARILQRRQVEGGKASGFLTFSHKLNDRLLQGYRFTLEKTLRYPKTIMLSGFLLFLVTMLLLYILPRTLDAGGDLGFIIGTGRTGQEVSTRGTTEYLLKANTIISQDPATECFVSLSGWGSYNTPIFFLRLKEASQRRPIDLVMGELSEKLNGIPGLNVYLKEIPFIDLSVGQGGNAEYQYVMMSLKPDLLYDAATKFTQKIQTLPGFLNVNNDLQAQTPQINMTLRRDVASTYGITAERFQGIFNSAFSGGRQALIQSSTNEYQVIVQAAPSFSNRPRDIHKLFFINPNTTATNTGQNSVANPNGSPSNMVPLVNIVDLEETVGISSVNHFNQFPAVTLYFSLAPDFPLSKAIDQLNTVANQMLPEGVFGLLQGVAEEFQETTESFDFLLIVAVLFIYILLGILYESYHLPLTVLSALPIAVLGGLLALLLFGEVLSLYATLGLVLLIGIVQKNGIMMVDFANDLMQEGQPADKAIYQAALLRFRPILMTTLAAIMGAVPVALGWGAGGGARRPLGLVLIGGLLLAQLLTLFLMPVVFISLERLRAKWSRKKVTS